MAIKQILVDDFTGSEGAETRSFSLDRNHYEIDLDDEGAAALAEALAPFIEVARKVTPATRRRSRAKPAVKAHPKVTKVAAPQSKADKDAIREWARSKGHNVSNRGRIPQDIVDEFNVEHNRLSPAFSG